MPKWVPRRLMKRPIRRRRCSRAWTAPGCRRLPRVGGGQYFELDRDGDRHIANAIIDAAKRRAPSLGVTEQSEDLYWRFLVIAGGLHDRRTALSARALRALDPADRRHPRFPRALHRDRVRVPPLSADVEHESGDGRSTFSVLRSSFCVRRSSARSAPSPQPLLPVGPVDASADGGPRLAHPHHRRRAGTGSG